MSDTDLEIEILHVVARLRVRTYATTLEQLTRGGLPASTRPDPGRARTTTVPELDQMDRAVAGWRQTHTAHLRVALNALLACEQLERRVIPPHPDGEPDRYDLWFTEMSKQAEMDHKAPSVKCANCERWVLQTPSDKLRSGRCSVRDVAPPAWRSRTARGPVGNPNGMKVKLVIELDDEVAREFVRRRFGDSGKRLEDVKWSIRTWAEAEITKTIATAYTEESQTV